VAIARSRPPPTHLVCFRGTLFPAAAERIDSDMRAYITAYSEKKTALTAADRKRTGNLMVRAGRRPAALPTSPPLFRT
jgi:hypothetical protein